MVEFDGPPGPVENIPNSTADVILVIFPLQPSNPSNNKVNHDGMIVMKAEPPRNTKFSVESEKLTKDHS